MKTEKHAPPRLAARLLKHFLPAEDAASLSHNYGEIYRETAGQKGRAAADLWFWVQVFLSIPRFIHLAFYWKMMMIRSHFKISFRNMIRYKGFTLINIAGLALGMAGFMVIFSFIRFELSYDDFHEHSSRIFRLVEKQQYQGQDPQNLGQTTPWMGETLLDYPEVEKVVNFIDIGVTKVGLEQSHFEIEGSLLADPDIFEVFSFDLIQGSRSTALSEPYTAVITQNTAERLFGSQNPLGGILKAGNGKDYKVTGVVKNIPRNSHIQFDILYSIEELRLQEPDWEDYNHNSPCYLLLTPGTDPKSLENKFPDHLKKYMPNAKYFAALTLQPLSEIHLRSQHIMWEINYLKGDITQLYFLSLIMIIILLLAAINYVNLTTARAVTRAGEVGIRKVVGAHRIQLIKQFLAESLVLAFLSFLGALALIELAKPQLHLLLSETTAFQVTGGGTAFFGLLGIMLVIGAASGIYPALVLSSFRPAAVLKGAFSRGGQGCGLRRLLVTAQFAMTIALIISTFMISRQLNYMRNRDTGFNRAHVLTIPLNSEMQRRYYAIKEELEKHPEIKAVTAATRSLGSHLWRNVIYFEGVDPKEHWVVPYMTVDYAFIPFYELKITKGRNFSRDFSDDQNGKSYIINEALVKKLGWENPIGKKFSHGSSIWGTVIGVVKDFNYRSLHSLIEPVVLFMRQDFLYHMSVKIDPEKIKGALQHLEQLWETYNPDQDFRYSFLDQKLQALYKGEERSHKLFSLFSGVAIFLSCLGLLGLVSFAVQQKTREIGIRKVLGSSAVEIFFLLGKEFMKWILLANLFAWPIAWYAMSRWLRNFAYRADFDAGVFLLGTALAFLISIVTLSVQILKAAGSNPADSLRYE